MFASGLVLLLVATGTYANLLKKCPQPQVHADFDLSKIGGKWYELEHTTSLDKIEKCNHFVIEPKETGKAGVLRKYIIPLLGKSKTEYSEITTLKSSEPAKLTVSPLKGTILTKKHSVWILDTDYDTYAVTFSCTNHILGHTQSVNILSRTKKIDDKLKMKIYDTLKNREVDYKNMSEMDHDDENCDKLEDKTTTTADKAW